MQINCKQVQNKKFIILMKQGPEIYIIEMLLFLGSSLLKAT